MPKASSIAVLLPCYNEGVTIATLVKSFRRVLPDAVVYVYDNNSRDNTVEEAIRAGAVVRHEALQGKGNVVRRMFADIDADIYVMADGDLTYPAEAAPELIALLNEQNLDMVVGVRENDDDDAYPAGHVFGNWLFNCIVRRIFGAGFRDVFSGYRVFSRRYVKSFPAHSSGFETETEMCIHALDMRMACGEIPVAYGVRPEGSASKLNTLRDGIRILRTIFFMFKEVRPLMFFGLLGVLLLIASLAIGYPVVHEFLQTGLVDRLPSAVLATGLALLSGIAFTCGLILDSVARASREVRRLHYLRL